MPKLSHKITGADRSAGDDGESSKEEARRRARLGAPDAITYLLHVIKDDTASTHQRVRASNMVLDAGGLLQVESRPTGLFDLDTHDADGRATS